MDYLNLISEQKQNKTAIIADGQSYTYGDLVRKAADIRCRINKAEKYIFIREEKIIDQLILFLAYSGTDCKPIIATAASKNQQFTVEEIPPSACMGVMTSGSTGKSKLFWRSYYSWADFFPLQNRVFGIDEQTVIFCQGSLAFTGNLNIYLGVFAAGGTVVATEKFRPKYWLDLMLKYNVNAIYLIPTKLLLLPKFSSMPNSSIKQIVSGSQNMDKSDALKLKRLFPDCIITLYYGASELNYITYIKDTEMTDDRTVVGKPFANVKITIRNEEIFIDTPYHVEGVTLPFSLKDRGYIDDEGSLHFLGRKDDICNINGLKISLNKVENALRKILDIDEAALLPFRQNDSDVLCAFIPGSEKQNKTALIRELRTYLNDFEIPKYFIYLKSLPKNESGKIDKFKLYSMIEQNEDSIKNIYFK